MDFNILNNNDFIETLAIELLPVLYHHLDNDDENLL